MQGLVQKGYGKLAREICLNHYAQVFEVYKKTGTFWEYYAPESAEPGFMARDNFVGWAGLPPIAELIEFIIGIRGDYAKKQIIWYGLILYPIQEMSILKEVLLLQKKTRSTI